MKTFFIKTFGCQMNLSDSERIRGELEKFLEYSNDISKADLIIVNMCSIRQQAVDRVFDIIHKSKKTKAKILVTGCILKQDNILFEKSDYIFPIKDLKKWEKYLRQDKTNQFSDPRTNKKDISYLKLKPRYRSSYSIEIPISFGCDNFCTYCVVPYTRGPLISRNHDDIIKEAKLAIKKGVKEIWLLGQNVNDYKSKDFDFSKLLTAINNIKGDFWIRYTSPHPGAADKEFFQTLEKLKKVTPYINFPVQAGDNKVLKEMNRPYTIEKYKRQIKAIRKAYRNEVCITTDVIVGFPGETKEQFNNTKELFKEIEFDMAYISQYSKRKGTPAYSKDNITKIEKKRRSLELTKILDKTAKKNNKKYINKDIRVLVNEYRDGYLIGKTQHYKTIKIKYPKNLIGEFINAKVVKATTYGLLGEYIKPKLIVILGPTASGKTDLSIKLAKKFNGEIISADSRQIYKYLDIGTGKITKREMLGIPHHMLDILHPKEKFSSIDFKNKAELIIRDIIKRGKTPILVGGSAFYIYPLTDGWIMPEVKADNKLRKELEQKNLETLQKKLKQLDPKRYKTIQLDNKRRVIRAIEIATQLGEVPEIQNNPEFDCLFLGIKRDNIKELINKRLDKRIKDGMLKEGEKVSKIISHQRMRELGLEYKWMSMYLKNEVNLKEFKEHLLSDIWKFQKHQMNWFNKDKRIHWIKTTKESIDLIKKHLL